MEWISIKENGNPKEPNDYLIYTTEGLQYVASWYEIIKNQWIWQIRCECCNAEDCLLTNDMITHWMPLSLPPL